MKPPGTAAYEFGPFRMDPAERLLRLGPDVVPLPPKAVDTLLVLLENAGHAVEKTALINRVWPDTFVEEGALTQNISLLRKALNETPQDRYIETIPKRGYRFIAPVCSNAPVATAERSILVLPLVNLSPDPAQEFFADGMTDELISQLMRTDSLRVVSRTTAMTYKEGNKSIRQIADELKADWVVEGAVLHSGDRVRISARLIDASTERNLWAQSYERDVRNVLELQSDVAGAITREIRMKVTPDGQRPAAAIRPVDPKAYVTYLRARYFWNKRTVEDIRPVFERQKLWLGNARHAPPAPCHLRDLFKVSDLSGVHPLGPFLDRPPQG